MHKVLVERPRRNPGRNKFGGRANLPDELLPKFEGIKRPHRRHKWQRDLFGPLRRWLRSQVGRPWNDIYSDACTVIHPDNYVRVHVKTHLLELVERHTFMHDGEVWCFSGGGWSVDEIPINEVRGRHHSFFVHPETGVLNIIPKISRRAWAAQKPKPAPIVHWVRQNVAIQQIRGLWFECYYKFVPYWEWFDPYDHALERKVTPREVQRYEHFYHLCTRKRQLSTKELRHLGLRNTPTAPSMGARSSADIKYCRLNTVLKSSIGSSWPWSVCFH